MKTHNNPITFYYYYYLFVKGSGEKQRTFANVCGKLTKLELYSPTFFRPCHGTVNNDN